MRVIVAIAVALAVASTLQPAAAPAAVFVQINKSAQQMTVSIDGETRYVWPVSTGRPGYDTPSGTFRAFRMEADHFSKEWDDAPMPHSIFFTTEGHAIHGTDHVRHLGAPASHGCVRLSRAHAAVLFDLVKREGLLSTKVALTGHTPALAPPMARRGTQDARELSGMREPQPLSLNPGGYGQSNDGNGFAVYGRPPAYGEQAPPAVGGPAFARPYNHQGY